ncbi:MAG: formate dehydrogenase subunit delta [Burkholderiaceae bacterium]
MDTDNLIRMANRIGEFFSAMPDHAEALDGIAGHIQRFWEPRMRRALLSHLESTGGEGLSPIVLEAVRRHQASLTPA